jgi:hypothetical protein
VPILGAMMRYYVDSEGQIKDDSVPPAGYYFSYEDDGTYESILIVNETDFEIVAEYCIWDSLEELKAAIK